jgi:hypothetical protein
MLGQLTVALLTSTGRGISLLSPAARVRGSDKLPQEVRVARAPPQLQIKPTAEKPEVAGERSDLYLPYVEVHGLCRQFGCFLGGLTSVVL